MTMNITVTMSNGAVIEVMSTGKYSPDVMHDLKNRTIELMGAAIDSDGELVEQAAE